MTPEQLDAVEKDAARRDEATATILMLVKTLREARTAARYEKVDSDVEIEKCTVERDEARAEVERLKAKQLEDARWIYDTGQRAKDAQAEVERLREAIGNALTNGHMNSLCWAQNDDECVGRCRLLREALGVHP